MNTKRVIKELLDENLIGAKKEIMDLLYEKMSEKLGEAYMEVAPTLVSEGKKYDKDGDGDEDSEDWKIARDEAIKKNKKKKKKVVKEEDEYEDEEEENEDEEEDEEETPRTPKPSTGSGGHNLGVGAY